MAEERIVRKSNAKSPVWDHFGFKAGEDGKAVDDGKPICLHCKRSVVARWANTSNLFSHLRSAHPIQYELAHSGKKKTSADSTAGQSTKPGGSQLTLAEAFSQSQKYDRKSKRWQQLTDSVTYCLAKDMLPIYSVEKPGFKQMMATFDKQYTLRKYFSNTAIPALYTRTREQVMQEVAQADFFSATTDLWSSEGMKPYMSYMVHFITNEWELTTRCLETLFLPADHTGENIADAMLATLESWRLDQDKQVCLTTDSGANIINAASRLKWQRLSCFGHNLHLAVTKAIDSDVRCTRALGLSRKIVSTFSNSWKKRRDLAKAQMEHSLPQHSLVADCQTRWGSAHKMVSRILEQETAIRAVLSADRMKSHLIPSWQDIEVLEAINKALTPVADLTDLLSGEKYVSISAVKPVLSHMSTEALAESDDDTPLTKDIKRRILTDIESRYLHPDVDELLDIASFLDPRFKTEHICHENVDSIKARLQDEGMELAGCISVAESVEDQAEPAETDNEPPPKKKKLAKILKKKNRTTSSTSRGDQMEKEMESYLSAPDLDAEDNPLLWWKAEALRYPILAKLAKKYLAICATSSASEQVFSASGKIVTPLRSLLKPDKVNKLVFLSQNL